MNGACECNYYACYEMFSDAGQGLCTCIRGGDDSLGAPAPACKAAYAHCCADTNGGLCMCSDTPCLAGTETVPSCSVAGAACSIPGIGGIIKEVSSCR